MKQQFLENRTDTIRLTIYQDNRALVPTAATIILKNPAGNVIEAENAATINSTTG